MNKVSLTIGAMAISLAVASPHAESAAIDPPYFGDEMHGIHQAAAAQATTPQVTASSLQDCSKSRCNGAQKANLVQKRRKLLP